MEQDFNKKNQWNDLKSPSLGVLDLFSPRCNSRQIDMNQQQTQFNQNYHQNGFIEFDSPNLYGNEFMGSNGTCNDNNRFGEQPLSSSIYPILQMSRSSTMLSSEMHQSHLSRLNRSFGDNANPLSESAAIDENELLFLQTLSPNKVVHNQLAVQRVKCDVPHAIQTSFVSAPTSNNFAKEKCRSILPPITLNRQKNRRIRRRTAKESDDSDYNDEHTSASDVNGGDDSRYLPRRKNTAIKKPRNIIASRNDQHQKHTLVSAPASCTGDHVCPYEGCQKRFRKPSALKRHIRSHTNERPFKCTWVDEEGMRCMQAFSERGNLQRHLRVHRKERPYACLVNDCHESFGRRTHLLNHYRSKHNLLAHNLPTAAELKSTSAIEAMQQIIFEDVSTHRQLALTDAWMNTQQFSKEEQCVPTELHQCHTKAHHRQAADALVTYTRGYKRTKRGRINTKNGGIMDIDPFKRKKFKSELAQRNPMIIDSKMLTLSQDFQKLSPSVQTYEVLRPNMDHFMSITNSSTSNAYLPSICQTDIAAEAKLDTEKIFSTKHNVQLNNSSMSHLVKAGYAHHRPVCGGKTLPNYATAVESPSCMSDTLVLSPFRGVGSCIVSPGSSNCSSHAVMPLTPFGMAPQLMDQAHKRQHYDVCVSSGLMLANTNSHNTFMTHGSPETLANTFEEARFSAQLSMSANQSSFTLQSPIFMSPPWPCSPKTAFFTTMCID